jgi:hypothetical protein
MEKNKKNIIEMENILIKIQEENTIIKEEN